MQFVKEDVAKDVADAFGLTVEDLQKSDLSRVSIQDEKTGEKESLPKNPYANIAEVSGEEDIEDAGEEEIDNSEEENEENEEQEDRKIESHPREESEEDISFEFETRNGQKQSKLHKRYIVKNKDGSINMDESIKKQAAGYIESEKKLGQQGREKGNLQVERDRLSIQIADLNRKLNELESKVQTPNKARSKEELYELMASGNYEELVNVMADMAGEKSKQKQDTANTIQEVRIEKFNTEIASWLAEHPESDSFTEAMKAKGEEVASTMSPVLRENLLKDGRAYAEYLYTLAIASAERAKPKKPALERATGTGGSRIAPEITANDKMVAEAFGITVEEYIKSKKGRK